MILCIDVGGKSKRKRKVTLMLNPHVVTIKRAVNAEKEDDMV